MNVLVVGADRVDAGKTTFSVGLCSYLDATGVKPRAGNDFWFDHDDCLRALRSGDLYGKDADRLASASPKAVDPTEINPVHRLWYPSPGADTGLLGRRNREFLIDRIEDEYVINSGVDLPDLLVESLDLENAVRVDSVEALNAMFESRYEPAFERLTELIEGEPATVIESYGDIALPMQSLERIGIDLVVAVEPRRVRLYLGDRYLRGCSVARSSPVDGRIEKRVGDVCELLDPIETMSLSALSADVRSDPVSIATAYAPAYSTIASNIE